MILGVIGDDFTGSSDIANTLARGGLRTTLYAGVPNGAADGDVGAGVVALKTRTIPAGDAVAQSLAALAWLRAQGCRQYFFKICSTFDSTDAGNIGPVAEALAGALGAERVLVCPAFPATGRSVYMGHLFVGDRLLSESSMKDHPLTPMGDPDLRRVLARQASGAVGHIAASTVALGAEAVATALAEAPEPLLIADAVDDADLFVLGEAAQALPLLVGGSGLALGLPREYTRRGLVSPQPQRWEGVAGPAVALAGSVSAATRGQVERHRADGHPLHRIDVEALVAGDLRPEALTDWALSHQGEVPLIASSAEPAAVEALQARFGRERVAGAIETLFAETAKALVERGLRRLVVAGGETAGAVVTGLGLEALAIGPEIDPGVPALASVERPLALALKSGNFGAPDFFAKAARILEGA